MAYKIVESGCTGCGSCESVCPSKAIKMKGDLYFINPDKCTECQGKFDVQQCVANCPADTIVHAG